MTDSPVIPARDAMTRFLLEGSGVRGVLVRLHDTWTRIRSRAAYPEPVAACLGEAAAAAALLTSHVKIDGRLSVQLRGSGSLRTLFVECTRDGNLRGLARYVEPVPAPLTPRAFGADAMLAITIENMPSMAQAARGRDPSRYQGIVDLDADTLAAAFEGYFNQSEQLPTRLLLTADGDVAAGLMLQQLPSGARDPEHHDQDGWNRACALFETLDADELLRLDGDTLLWRLFHDEGIRVLDSRPLRFACSCSTERVTAMLHGLGRSEALAAAAANPVAPGIAEIHCEFCGQAYRLDRVDIEQLFTTPASPAPQSLQ